MIISVEWVITGLDQWFLYMLKVRMSWCGRGKTILRIFPNVLYILYTIGITTAIFNLTNKTKF